MVSNDIIKRQEEISSRLDVIRNNDSQTGKEQDKPFNIDLQSNATLNNKDSDDRGQDLKMQLQRAKYTNNIKELDDEPDEDVIQSNNQQANSNSKPQGAFKTFTKSISLSSTDNSLKLVNGNPKRNKVTLEYQDKHGDELEAETEERTDYNNILENGKSDVVESQSTSPNYINKLTKEDEPTKDVIRKKLPYIVSMRLTEELILYLNSKAKHPTKYIRQLIIDDMIRDKAWQDQRSRYGEIEQ